MQKTINVNRIEHCCECPREIKLYEYMYREKQQAPKTDKIYCSECGRKYNLDNSGITMRNR